MTMIQRGLPLDLLFEADGHVSDLCVTAVADGEIAIVPKIALDHLDACDACGARLGEAALTAVMAHEAMLEGPRATAAAPLWIEVIAPVSPRRSRWPTPIAAIAAALLLAVITAGPALSDGLAAVPEIAKAAVGWLPTLVRIAASVAWSGAWSSASLGPWWVAVKALSAVMFVVAGLSVARVTSRRRAAAIEGGMR